MAFTLNLVGNLINGTQLFGGAGHLQIVFGEPGNETEIEVQAPDFLGVTGGDWVYYLRDHTPASNTPFYQDPDRYASTTLLNTDDAAIAAWGILLQVHEQMEAFSPNLEYNLLDQNSNSYANSALSVIGFDLASLLASVTPTNVNFALGPNFPGAELNVLTSTNVDTDGVPFSPDLTLGGGEFADTMITGRGNDFLFGYGGDDTLRGGAGDDYLQGGDGSDLVDGGAGMDDFAVYDMSESPINVDLAAGTVTAGTFVDTLINIEHIIGSDNTETIAGDGNANILSGLGGNDTISGAGGADTLMGGAGTDILDGGAGDDIIDAGDVGEDDRMTGGAGEDVFIIRDGQYVIEDFAAGEDFLLFDGTGLTFGNLTIVESGSRTVVSNLALQVTFLDTAEADLTSDYFIFA